MASKPIRFLILATSLTVWCVGSMLAAETAPTPANKLVVHIDQGKDVINRDKSGAIHVSLCNLNPNAAVDVACDLPGIIIQTVSGRILTAPQMQAHNTFEQPETVKPAEFAAFQKTDHGLTITLPAKSVVVLAIK